MEVHKHSRLVNSETQRLYFESLCLSSQGRSNVFQVTSKDTDVVGVKLLFTTTSLPGLNEGSFDEEYSWCNRIATRLWVYVLRVVVIKPQLQIDASSWCVTMELGLYNNNRRNVHSQLCSYPITPAIFLIKTAFIQARKAST